MSKKDIKKISDMIEMPVDDVNSIVKEFTNKFSENISVVNITDAMILLMQLVGKYNKLSGHNKKYLVIQILISVVKNTNVGQMDELLDNILISVIPVIIDKMISVEKGRLVINPKIKNTCLPCF